jgi:xanthine dehydrogenase YagT iron-sulfur-binding subunit
MELTPAGAARRRFFVEAGTVTTDFVAAPHVLAADIADVGAKKRHANRAAPATATVHVRLVVNGRTHDLDLDPRVTLLDALREHLT